MKITESKITIGLGVVEPHAMSNVIEFKLKCQVWVNMLSLSQNMELNYF